MVSSTSTRNRRGVEPTSSVAIRIQQGLAPPTMRETATACDDFSVDSQGLGLEPDLSVSTVARMHATLRRRLTLLSVRARLCTGWPP